jgi:two-component system response regulator PilR (NtrC family)
MPKMRVEDVVRDADGERLVGESSAIQYVIEEIAILAPHPVTVVVLGETGVGKDLVARLIHENSPRRHQSFVRVDCGTIPEDLWESECFGSVRGAFTGAQNRAGLFQQADGGTLFLNEFHDLSRRHQAKLKEFVQYRCLRRVGDTRWINLDVRLIIASNHDLERMAQEHQLAYDLLQRLGSSRIIIPPLRGRRQDIPALVEYVLQRISQAQHVPVERLSAEAMRLMSDYPWPGNVRQLQNVVEAACLRCDGAVIDATCLFSVLNESEQALSWPCSDHHDSQNGHDGLRHIREATEREMIEQALAVSPSLRAAARRVGVSLSTLQYKIRKHNLNQATCLI